MLVQTYNHLIPHSTGAPTVLSSPTTSTYIPEIPYDDFTRPLHLQPEPSIVASSRRDRRIRTAPYPLSIPSSAAPFQLQQDLARQKAVPLHSPRPVVFFDPAQAFDNVTPNVHVHSPLGFAPGAHGTILGSFATRDQHTSIPGSGLDELTATQMAYMQATNLSVHSMPSSLSIPPSASACGQPNQGHVSDPSFAQIRVPQVPSIPQVPTFRPTTVRPIDVSASSRPHGIPHLPDAIPPEASQMNMKPSGTLPPPSDTFPTPVELLGELSLRDAETAQKDRRRAERRKEQMRHEAETLGYTLTDPDTISTHDKKRLYLDCLEQYVIYLHNQLRLAGLEPVPVERVSSGRGLTSRSIRTMIVHLKNVTAKLHVQKREAELKYDELRAQLGAEADLTAPTLVASNAFRSTSACAIKASVQQSVRTPAVGPRADSSLRMDKNGDTNSKCSTRRHSVATSRYAASEPRPAPDASAEISNGTVTATGAGVQAAYSFP